MNSKTVRLFLIACLARLVASQLDFLNFPLNLTLPVAQSLDLNWHGQDSYVNITLAQFYYFGGGSEIRDSITTFDHSSAITWTPDSSLQQGIYAFFIKSPNRNSSESPFFALTVANSTSSSAASLVPATARSCDVAKIGIGVGVPLGFVILSLLGFILWREKTWCASARSTTSIPKRPQRTLSELDSKSVVFEV